MQPVIGIIGGHGRMGQLFADFFAERQIKVLISDLGSKLSNQELAAKSDIIIVSVPIDFTVQTIEEVLPYIRKESAIMDFTSVKTPAIKAMLKGKCEVLGLHPMFGNSNPIPGQTIILCPTKKSTKWSQWIEKFFTKNRVKIIKMTAKEHDKTMSIAQGLIHFSDIAFADSIRRMKKPVQEVFKYCSLASQLKIQLASRLIDQDPGLYANIQITNPHTLKALKNCQKSVNELTKIVQKKNVTAFKNYFKRNQSFLGSYTKEAYADSSHLIEKFQLLKKKVHRLKTSKPQKKDLAILGPRHTFTDICATVHLQPKNKFYAKSIEEVCELVETSQVSAGIIPIENKLEGTVRATIDQLFYRNIHICRQMSIPIDHNLITLAQAKKNQIKQIISHPQALNQCKKYLHKNFPKADLIPSTSTAAAAETLLLNQNPQIAVIASALAVENQTDLKIIQDNIADQPGNETTFILIKKGKAQNNGLKTSIAFHFNADSSGNLFGIFKEFADAKINMTKIESRPTKSTFGDYIFYLDFEGGLSDAKVKTVLEKIEKQTAKLKVLGSY